jgi:hypothetical protein
VHLWFIYFLTVNGVGEAAHITVNALTLTAFSVVATEVGNVSMSLVSGQVMLSWNTEFGVSYGVQATDDLASGTWTAINSDIVGIDGTCSVTNDISEEQQFFRPYLEE